MPENSGGSGENVPDATDEGHLRAICVDYEEIDTAGVYEQQLQGS